ncbi:SpoIIE family protein phosphatase [Flavobacterium suzhouense]|uniref:SpoIIE family protein phosphatase n=1 Tax=Flavobacterium suzhouense TaxID=1529638 RepID=A0ABW5NZD5_9FLAO
MDNSVFVSYKIEERSYVSFVKREIHNLTNAEGFSAQKIGEIDIIIAELTSNLIKFAKEGEMLYRIGADDNGVYFEVYCMDNGSGIKNLSRMMQDGMSSSETLGHGLGSIERLSDVSSIYTNANWGTIVYSKVYKEPYNRNKAKKEYELGSVQVCCPGEVVSGDGFAVKRVNGLTQFFMGDGLGHGVNAHEAVQTAIKAFNECTESSPTEILRYIHLNVKKTRGLVATVACLDLEAKRWTISGIGNISTSLYTGLSVKNYTPYNGILGLNIPRTINDSVMALDKYQMLIMHSDGLRTRWNLTDLPAILKYDPNIIAASIYKDNARYNDDMTIFAAKINM